MDEDGRQILAALRRMASGEAADDGRDEVSTLRVTSGAMGSGGLVLDARRDEEVLRVAGVELRFARQGEFVFEHGELGVRAASDGNPELADAVARWLGVPLGAAGDASPVGITYVRLGVKRDADGADWDLFKLFLSRGQEYAEVFLRVRADGGAVAFAEKWSRYRVELVVLLDAAVGRARQPLPHAALSIGGRQVQLTIPTDWIVSDGPGCVNICDPTDECALQLSYLHLPALPDAPSVEDQVRSVVVEHDPAAAVHTRHERALRVAWAEYEYASDDPHRTATRRARNRVLIASNGTIQALLTFCYWVDDASWAVPAWERIVTMLRLGDGGALSEYGPGPLAWTRTTAP